MTNYEGSNISAQPRNEWGCQGWLNIEFSFETAPFPDNPKMYDWSVTACVTTYTTCMVDFIACDFAKKFINMVNYGNQKQYPNWQALDVGRATDDPRRPNFPKAPLFWPAPTGSEKLPNGNTLMRFESFFAKCFFLGCCSDGCDHGPPGSDGQTIEVCHTMNGTVNIDDLPDPCEAYHGIPPGSPIGYVEIDKVAAHAHLEAMKHFGPNGITKKPEFAPCCKDGGPGGSAGGSGGGSNG